MEELKNMLAQPTSERIITRYIEDELVESYLTYAMNVNTNRAIPDVRDGLKPSTRRILYAMKGMGLTHDKSHDKCAAVVGEVMKEYHPHGDGPIYMTLVGMAQDFAMRYPLIDGQGNFGCFTGDTRIKLLDGMEKQFAELAKLPPDKVFHVYSVDGKGRIVVGEGRNARVTHRKSSLLELTLDNGENIRCTSDHKFMLRDGTYKAAEHLTENDSLMPGYFDTATVKDGLNEYLRVLQPTTGEYEFVHHLADEFNEQKGLAQQFDGAFVRHHKNFNRWDNRPTNEDIKLEVYEANRDANWIPHIDKALQYFRDFDELLDEAKKYNHRVISKRWLDEHTDVYDITVDKYHNFLLASGVFVHNSIDADPPGAMRYTEARLAEIANEMLVDIEKNTVDFQPNYKESTTEPKVLPAKLPNLLLNGTTGIGVGYSSKIPPHNLSEIVDATIILLENPQAAVEDLMEVVPGPDFPTRGLIVGRGGIRDAYTTGRGSITMRARSIIERERGSKESIIISEIPYQVKKSALIDKIYELVENKKITGVTDIRDESDEDIRIVIELRRGEISQVILNRLYKHTQMQRNFSVIMLCLVDGQPKVLNFKEILWNYLEHRREVIRRRTRFDLDRCERRKHILEGLRIAISNLDEVIAIIEAADSPSTAREHLMANFELSQLQADEILNMQLRRLTSLERDDINTEYADLLVRIEELRAILESEELIKDIIKQELLQLKDKYGDERKTEIVDEINEFEIEDLIADENMVITISHEGYIKRIPVSNYRTQRRKGVGSRGMETKEEDFVEYIFVATNHQYILFFTDKGKCYWLKVFEIPELGKAAKGRAIVNMLRIEQDENITAFVPVREFDDKHYLLMATENGMVKKCNLMDFSRPYSSGIVAISFKDDEDKLIGVKLTNGNEDIVMVTRNGQSIRFKETDVRSMGRSAGGVKGIVLVENDRVVGMDVVRPDVTLLTITENGYGKRTDISEHTLQKRGGKGMIAIRVTERNGPVVGMKMVYNKDDLIVTSSTGMVIRTPVKKIRVISRSTQGVGIMSLLAGEKVVDIAKISSKDEEKASREASAKKGEELDTSEE